MTGSRFATSSSMQGAARRLWTFCPPRMRVGPWLWNMRRVRLWRGNSGSGEKGKRRGAKRLRSWVRRVRNRKQSCSSPRAPSFPPQRRSRKSGCAFFYSFFVFPLAISLVRLLKEYRLAMRIDFFFFFCLLIILVCDLSRS